MRDDNPEGSSHDDEGEQLPEIEVESGERIEIGAPFESTDNDDKIQLSTSSPGELEIKPDDEAESIKNMSQCLGFQNEDHEVPQMQREKVIISVLSENAELAKRRYEDQKERAQSSEPEKKLALETLDDQSASRFKNLEQEGTIEDFGKPESRQHSLKILDQLDSSDHAAPQL